MKTNLKNTKLILNKQTIKDLDQVKGGWGLIIVGFIVGAILHVATDEADVPDPLPTPTKGKACKDNTGGTPQPGKY